MSHLPISLIGCPMNVYRPRWPLAMRLMVAAVAAVLAWTAGAAAAADLPARPNILFILADDLGYGDLGCYGQQEVQTPHLDRMAAQGMRFTDAYAGSTVCAPSRCVLMTGLHTGHARVRGNARVPLRPEDTTVAELLQRAGYATGLIGKWGLGEPGTTGIPNRKGFNYFFGYLNQHLAHNYYPDNLWRNQEQVRLPNVVQANVASHREVYSHDMFTDEALAFVERHKDGPFFLYLAYTIPHANNEAGARGMEVPSYAPYEDRDWPEAQKGFAAMVTRMDRDIGRLLDKLAALGIDEQTLVIFSSDNGPHREGGNNPRFFRSSGPLRGIKRDLYEGGIRVPMIARWPGQIAAGSTSALPTMFCDFLPTAAELAGVEAPQDIDGQSIVPELLGVQRAGRAQTLPEFLYWEFHEGGFEQAVRTGPWKAVRTAPGKPLELYHLPDDLGEQRDVAASHPEIVQRIEAYLRTARTDSPHWPIKR
jgi:arylsulfatase A-like enzyme